MHLKPWSQRPGRPHSAQALVERAFGALGRLPGAIVFPLNPPPMPELGVASGFDFELEDRAGLGHAQLMAAAIAHLQLQGRGVIPHCA